MERNGAGKMVKQLSTRHKQNKLLAYSAAHETYICPACRVRGFQKAGYKFYQCGTCGSTHDTDTLKAQGHFLSRSRAPLARIVAQSRLNVLATLEMYLAKGWQTPPSVREIAELIGASQDTVRRSIEELHLLGIVGYTASSQRRLPRALSVRITRSEWDSQNV